MLKILTCPRGHRWGYAGPAHQPTCPICGGRSVPSREGSDPRVASHSALPTVVNAGANADNPHLPSDERVTLALPSAAPAEVDEHPTLELEAEATVEYADGSQDSVAPPQIADYKVLRELGRGGMGVVYQAVQKSLKRTVALKMILAGEHAGPVERRRFHREAEAIARPEHPNIVKIYEVGEAEGRPFLSLEYVDGGSLAQRLTGTPLPPRQAARLIALLSQAIETAHQQGFVHRDLKPANILLSTNRSKSPAGTAPAG